jgi:ribose-phosphate pyrophosphokinase
MTMHFLSGIGNIVTLDVHNNKVASWFAKNVDPTDYIVAAIEHTAVRNDTETVCVLYPDEGAAKRYALPRLVGNNTNPIVVLYFYATKVRDAATGKLLRFDVPKMPEGLPILIVDDICDGGGTFLGIQAAVNRPMSLYTTHSMYSKGTDVLYNAGFEYLYTTNSYYPDVFNKPDKMVVYDCIPKMLRS